MQTDLQYPIGKFDMASAGKGDRQDSIERIASLPSKLAEAVNGISENELERPYRPGGWTVRQTVHHIADSHLNAVCRFKLALTEDKPTIRPYLEDRWAELADSRLQIEPSMRMIEGTHARWAALLRSMSENDFARRIVHPESGEFDLAQFLDLYAWHSLHHSAHIRNALAAGPV
jgi:uncharacterized damage-inducible protein DinB